MKNSNKALFWIQLSLQIVLLILLVIRLGMDLTHFTQ